MRFPNGDYLYFTFSTKHRQNHTSASYLAAVGPMVYLNHSFMFNFQTSENHKKHPLIP